jgi:hypothetical protein
MIRANYNKSKCNVCNGKRNVGENHPMWGRHQSEETKKKRSNSLMNHNVSIKTRIKIGNANRGKRRTDEMKRKMSIRLNGIGNPFYGKNHSFDTKERISKTLSIILNKPEVKRKFCILAKKRFLNKENHPMFGKRHSKESKIKMRLSRIKYLNDKFGGGICPTYNPVACKIIDDYGKKHGYDFQHAMNGGEFYIKDLGYWADGYDKKKNTIIEYYEKHHNYHKKHDNERKSLIIKMLKCTFIEMWYDGKIIIRG